MDFQSAMETFAEAWVAANTKVGPLVDTSVQVSSLFINKSLLLINEIIAECLAINKSHWSHNPYHILC